MDENEFMELEKSVDRLVTTNANPGIGCAVSAEEIAKDLHYSVPFVKYVLDSVDIHCNEEKLLRHMVQYTALKMDAIDERIPRAECLSATDFASIAPLCAELKNDVAFSVCSVGEENPDKLARQFPLLVRIALVASYCASYNPQATDRHIFFLGKDFLKRKSRCGGTTGRAAQSEDKWHESGPRPFDHQRAMFIFLFFCKQFDEKLLSNNIPSEETDFFASNALSDCESAVDFTSQVIPLVEAGLLQLVSATENLDLPKYRCLCSLRFAQQIARSISSDFDLLHFLSDFASAH